MTGQEGDLVFLGLIGGAGLWLLLDSLLRPVGRWADGKRFGVLTRTGLGIEGFVRRHGAQTHHERDLAVTGRSIERHATAIALGAILGGLLPIVGELPTTSVGIQLPPAALAAACLVTAAAGVTIPVVELHRAAQAARSRFRSSFGCWLELVVLAQAGGMGLEGALEAASRIGGDEAFAAIRAALFRARATGTTPWASLGGLGRELGVGELEELAATLSLAGSEGARVRSSLAAKAASLRRKQLCEAAAQANATTERLFLPSVVLMVGFLVFLIYPASVSLGRVL